MREETMKTSFENISSNKVSLVINTSVQTNLLECNIIETISCPYKYEVVFNDRQRITGEGLCSNSGTLRLCSRVTWRTRWSIPHRMVSKIENLGALWLTIEREWSTDVHRNYELRSREESTDYQSMERMHRLPRGSLSTTRKTNMCITMEKLAKRETQRSHRV